MRGERLIQFSNSKNHKIHMTHSNCYASMPNHTFYKWHRSTKYRNFQPNFRRKLFVKIFFLLICADGVLLYECHFNEKRTVYIGVKLDCNGHFPPEKNSLEFIIYYFNDYYCYCPANALLLALSFGCMEHSYFICHFSTSDSTFSS